MVGSVTAELLLKTEQFNKAIGDVEKKVKGLNTAFRGTDAQQMAKDITRLEEQLEKCTNVINKQEEVINKLKASYESARAEADKLSAETKKVAQENNNLTKSQENIVRNNEKVMSSFNKFNAELQKTGKASRNLEGYMNTLLNAMNKGLRADSSKVIKNWREGSISAEKLIPSLGSIQSVINQFGGMNAVLYRYNEAVSSSQAKTQNFQAEFTRFNPVLHEVMNNLQMATLKYNSFAQSLANVQHGFPH